MVRQKEMAEIVAMMKKIMIETAAASAVVGALPGLERELVRVRDEDVGRAGDGLVGRVRPPAGEQVDGGKLLKLKANDAIRSGAVATRRSGSVTFRKTCRAVAPSTRAASVSSAGIACRAPVADEEEVREAEPEVDEDAGHLGPGRVEQPRDVDPEERC